MEPGVRSGEKHSNYFSCAILARVGSEGTYQQEAKVVQGKCQSEGQEKTEFLSGSHIASTDIVCLSEARILHRV